MVLDESEWNQALCRQTDPDLWFPEVYNSTEARTALRFCRRCPMIDPCLLRGLRPRNLDFGIWGGRTPRQRRKLRELARWDPMPRVKR